MSPKSFRLQFVNINKNKPPRLLLQHNYHYWSFRKYNWVFLYFIHMTTILINSVSVSYISILCRAKFCLVCLSRQLRNSTQAKKNSKNSKNFARLNRWTVYGTHRRAKFGRTKFIYLVCWIAFRFYIIELNSLDKQLHWAGYLAYLI